MVLAKKRHQPLQYGKLFVPIPSEGRVLQALLIETSLPQVYVPLPKQAPIQDMLFGFWETEGNFQPITPQQREHMAKVMVQNKHSGNYPLRFVSFAEKR